MVLTVHHLSRSQSERIVWLCEELALPYDLRIYARSPLLAPPSLKALHPSEAAPVITDGAITLAESGAIVEYILVKYADGRLQLKPDDEYFSDYLYWLHYANGTLQHAMSTVMFLKLAKLTDDNPMWKVALERREKAVRLLDVRLRECEWLAGDTFTAADVMTVVSVTTMRLFDSYALDEYPNVLRYLERVGRREAYWRAMEKGEPDMQPLLGREAPKSLI